MRQLEKIQLFFIVSTLILSFASFSNAINTSQLEATKTELVVEKQKSNSRFSIQFLKVNKIISSLYYNNPDFSFYKFKYIQNLNEQINFKYYSNKRRSVLTDQHQIKIYNHLNLKILYEKIS